MGSKSGTTATAIQKNDEIKQIMYSPLSGKHEIFIRNVNAPPKLPHNPLLENQRHFGLSGMCGIANSSLEKSSSI